MYKNILVPMALDHGASPSTLALANNLLSEGGKVTALHVHESLPSAVEAYVDKTILKEGFEKAEALLREKTAKFPEIDTEVVLGRSYRAIIDYADSHGIDCIVIASHRPGVGDFLLGSTAARVVRHSNCSVHVHRSS